MATPKQGPSEVIDISPLGAKIPAEKTTTLVKTNALEVIRLVLPAGKSIPEHDVPGEITVQCLEGKVFFGTQSGERELVPGRMLYLDGSHRHSVRAAEDSSVLVTILLKPMHAEQ